jgi:hypothetical protein
MIHNPLIGQRVQILDDGFVRRSFHRSIGTITGIAAFQSNLIEVTLDVIPATETKRVWYFRTSCLHDLSPDLLEQERRRAHADKYL